MKILKALLLLIILIPFSVHAQQGIENQRPWSEAIQLTPEDFQMNIEVPESNPCFAQFYIGYSVSGFDFFSKNFNQKVQNVMFVNASWIDKNSDDIKNLLRFQQILFDMSEVYAREFRKRLLLNRKQISKGTQIVEQINNDVMREFSEERAHFVKESQGGTKTEVYDKWEQNIKERLQSMHLFRYENDKKIKLE